MSAQEIVRCLAGNTVRCCVALVLALCLVAPVLAQEPDGPTDDPYVKSPYTSVIKAPSTGSEKTGGGSSDSVTINVIDPSGFPNICTYVTVTHNGETVEGLDPDSFCVSQDGTPIDSFTVVEQTSDSCITRVVLVIDYSGSMGDGGKMTAARAAARRFIRAKAPQDRIAIVTFANCWVWRQSFTTDTVPLLAAVNALTNPSGRTAALDGIWKGLDSLRFETGTNKAVIALSDGMENWSQNCGSGLPDGLTDPQGFTDDLNFLDSLAGAIGAPVYTISLGTDFDPDYLEDIANATGGEYHHAPTNSALDAIYDAIKLSICTRYLICYTSPDTIASGDCHTVVICRDNADADKTGIPDCFVCDTGVYCEPYPPVITIEVDPACRRWGMPVDLCATVIDSDTPPESLTVKLYYRIFEPGGAFAQVTPTRNGNVWCYTIPATSLPCGKDSLEFYFTATDGNTAVASPFNAPASSHQVTICQNSPPTCEFGPDLAPPVCNPTSPIDFVPLNLTDIDGNKDYCQLYGDGQLVSGGWQYDNPVPGDTAYAYIVCFDSCGDSCWIEIERVYPPRETIPCNVPDGGDTAFFLCDPGQITIPISGGPGSGCVMLEGAGTFSNGQWQYNATKDTSITFVVQCISLCDSCRSSYTVNIDVNEPPVCGDGTDPNPKGGEFCDTVNFSDHFTLEFKSVSYDDENSTWCYELTWDGIDPGLSHLTIELCDTLTQSNFVASSPAGAEIKFDGSTGLYGIKWDSEDLPSIPANTAVQFCFTINRPLELAQASFVPKAGQNEDIVSICGPSTSCGEIPNDPGPSACDTTVFLCDPDTVCVPFSTTDPDGNLDSCRILSGIGSLVNGRWCFFADEAGTYFVTIQCIDSCGAQCERTICATVVIDEVPVITCPDPVTFECDSIGAFPTPTVVDGGYAPATISELERDSIPGQCPQSYGWVITWVATDTCGHADTCVQRIAIVDTTAPSISCPDTLVYECDSVPDIDSLPAPTIVDNCDESPKIERFLASSTNSECPQGYHMTILWVATDDCGNADSCTQVINVVDTTAPELIGCDTLVVIACDSFYTKESQSGLSPRLPTATDNCDTDPRLFWRYLGSSGRWPCDYVERVAIWAVDDCGNISDTCYQTLMLVDTIAPTIVCPDSLIFNCPIQPTLVPPQATDNCSAPTVDIIGYRTEDSTCPGSYRWIIIWEATDYCGLKDTCEQVIRFQDTTAPAFTQGCPPVYYECDEVPEIFPAPPAGDLCDPQVEVTLIDVGDTTIGDCPQRFSFNLYWEAKDDCGNADTCAQTVYVIDTTAPAVSCPSDTTLSCDELPIGKASELVVGATLKSTPVDPWPFGVPGAKDNCDESPEIYATVLGVDGSYPCNLYVVMGYFAVDSCGNVSDTCRQLVTVRDTTPPVVICPPDTTFECDDLSENKSLVVGQQIKSPAGALWPFGVPTGTDNCSDTVYITGYLSRILSDDPCSTVVEIAYVGYDLCQNSDTCYQLVTIVDTTAPVINCPDTSSVLCTQIPTFWVPPSATDNCSQPTVRLLGDAPRWGYADCPAPDTIVLTWVATDNCQNEDTCEQRVFVIDNTPPLLVCDPLRYECDELPAEWPKPPVKDDCDPSPVVTLLSNSDTTLGACPQRYSFVLTWEAMDECGNADTCEQTVFVIDTTGPVTTCPDDTIIACQDIPTSLLGSLNTSQAVPTTSPKSAGDKSIPIGQYPFGTPTALDNCDPVPVIYWFVSSQDGVFPCNKYFTIGYWSVDACGNIGDTCFQSVRIVDTIAPVITCPPDTTVDCILDRGLTSLVVGQKVGPEWPFGFATATDNCDTQPSVDGPTYIGLTYFDSCGYQIQIRFVATDQCGLADTCVQLITFVDTLPPTVDCPNDTTLQCIGSIKAAVDNRDLDGIWRAIKGDDPSTLCFPAKDDCDPEVCGHIVGFDVVDSLCPLIIRIHIVARDACVNTSDTCHWTVIVEDTTAPRIDCPAPTRISCNALWDGVFDGDSLGWPTAIDECDPTPEIILTGYTQVGEDCPYIIRRAFVAIDTCGNISDTCFQDITVYDENRPEISCPEAQFFECDVDTTLFALPTATDSCDPDPRVELILYSKDQIGECSYVLVRAWHAVDHCGNYSDTCRQVITVGDSTKPVVTCPGDTVIECQDLAPGAVDAWKSVPIGEYPFGMPSASDNCDSTLVVNWRIRSESGVFPCDKRFVIAYWTVDDCGNISDSCFQNVSIVDTIRPSITCPGDTVVDCVERPRDGSGKSYLQGFAAGTAVKDAQGCYEYDFRYGIPSATDNCTDDFRYCLWSVSGPEVDSCRVTYTLYFTAFDGCQLMSDTCSQRVTFVDTTAPVVDCADDTTVYCAGNELPPCFDEQSSGKSGEKFLCDFRLIDTLYDDCDPYIEYEYSLFYQTSECPRYIRATIWAVDDCGNVSDTCYWTVYFADTTSPVIACPSDINAECGTDPGDWGWPTATDDCGQPVIALLDIDTVAQTSCYLEVVRRFTATDFCGNADTCRQRIVIGDSTAPEITCPADTVVDCADPTAASGRALLAGWIPLPPKGRVNGQCELDYNFVFGRPSATDNCTSEPHICLTDVAQTHADSCRTEYELTFVATDDCGNTDTCTQTVTFIDKGRPVVVCAPDTTIYCDREKANCIELKGTEPFKLGDDKFLCGFRMVDTVYDACCEDVEVFVRLTYHMNQCPSYIRAFIWAKDCCGNYSDTCDWRLNIADTAAPEISCPADLNYQCDDVQGDWGWPTATDNCEGPVTITLVDQDTSVTGCQTVITRTFSAKDRCNLESRCIQTITISDTTDPVCRVPNDTTIFVCAIGDNICLPVSATDNCDQSVTCEVSQGVGTVENGYWCFRPTGPGPYSAMIRCTDDCGNVCADQVTATIVVNSAPTCHVPNDTTIYLCDPSQLYFEAWSLDVDGNIANCLAGFVNDDKTQGPIDVSDSSIFQFGLYVERDTTICMWISCTDSCGAVCYDTFCVTIDITEPPVCYQTPDTAVSLCVPQEVCIQYDWLDDPVSGTKSSDVVSAPRGGKGKYNNPPQVPNRQNQSEPLKTLLSDCQIISGPGYLKGDYWCWTPPVDDTTVTVLVQCADSCGHTCQNEFTVRFDMNEEPECRPIEDTSVFLCSPEPVCVTVAAVDTEGDSVVCEVVSGPGSVSDGQWCYTPQEDGVYEVTIRCTDTCGAYCEETFSLTVELNDPPVCQLPNDTTIFICDTATICLPLRATDPNGNFSDCVFDIVKFPDLGYVQDGLWCYFASADAQLTVPIICFDSCNAYCRGEFTVTIVRNDPPVCQLPNDTTIFLCEPGTVCLPIGATDANGNFSYCALDETKGSGSGYIQNGQWCINVTDDFQSNIYIVCYDSCGAWCQDYFYVSIIVNDPPVCNDLADTSVFLCEPTAVCRNVGATDPNGNLADCQVIAGPGVVSQGQWCFTPSQSGVYNVTIRCTDSCGAYCDESFALTVDMNDPPVCFGPPTDTTIFLCEPTNVCIGGWGATDPDGNLANCIILDDDKRVEGVVGQPLEWCDFIADNQTVLLTLQCTDSCGATCTRDVYIHFVLNLPPVINLGNDISTQVGQGQVCFNYTVSDPDNTLPLEEILLQFPAGAVLDTAANTICWTPEEGGLFMFVGKVVDSCNAEDVDTAFVIVAQPSPPICNIPGDTTVFQCAPAQISRPVSAISQNPPVSCQVVAGYGTVVSGVWRFTPPGPGVYATTIRCTDNLGQFCQDEFTVTVLGNTGPTCNVRDTSVFLCDPGQVCIPVSGTDPDGGAVTCTKISGPGTLSNGVWCYNATGDASFTVTFRCTDACGAYCEKTVTITIDMNQSPSCSFPVNQTVILCPGDMICFELHGSDADGNLAICGIKDGLGEVVHIGGGVYRWCYRPTGPGMVPVQVFCADVCGDTCFVTRQFTVLFNTPQICQSQQQGQVIIIGPAAVIPGDVNGSGDLNVADIALLTMLVHQRNVKGQTALIDVSAAAAGYQERADVNCDGRIDQADLAYLTAYIFSAGPAPCDPETE